MNAYLRRYLSGLPKYERAVHVAAVAWTGVTLVLQVLLVGTQRHLPQTLVLSAPGRSSAADPLVDRSTLIAVGWRLVAAMAVLTVLGLVLAHVRNRTGRYLSLVVAIAGVCAIPYAVPSVLIYYISGNGGGRAAANTAAVASLVLLIVVMVVTFNHPYWFGSQARDLRRRGLLNDDER